MIGAFLQSVIITLLANIVSFVVLSLWGRYNPIETGLPPDELYFGLYHIITLYISLMLWYWLGTFDDMRKRAMWRTLAFMILLHFIIYFLMETYEPLLRDRFFPGCTNSVAVCFFLQRFAVVL